MTAPVAAAGVRAGRSVGTLPCTRTSRDSSSASATKRSAPGVTDEPAEDFLVLDLLGAGGAHALHDQVEAIGLLRIDARRSRPRRAGIRANRRRRRAG